jgi:hypothetical protein
MSTPPLDPDRECVAQAIYQRIKDSFDQEALALARLLAAQDDRALLGATEFAVRDRVHRLGADALEAALAERKKGGTERRP